MEIRVKLKFEGKGLTKTMGKEGKYHLLFISHEQKKYIKLLKNRLPCQLVFVYC